MLIVDTHTHAGPSWFEPIEMLLCQMERNGVSKAVLVQYAGNHDNTYELECVWKYPGRFCAVVLVDGSQPDAPEELARWARKGAVGVRLTPGRDGLAIWRKAAQLGLVVSAAGRAQDFAAPEFFALVKELPDLKIVIEHLAGVRPDNSSDEALFGKVFALAELPNTYIKLPGFGECLPRPKHFQGDTFGPPPPVVRMAYEAFDSRRIMWGSDYPPVSSREGYTNALHYPMEHIRFFTTEDKEWIFGRAALSVWKFD